ncbi:clostripain-related cysteine peptidase [Bradyrhizobium neotropicale]|uniref:Clostripain n=1 Tax=Bradyrhizobium neotropicale TaxID=1497615 RepID=A0A176ZID8_9BRAD|nr:clostripain-related cysteine peptidase [Bradyrhizobium neotropicale]OAF19643.1 hypothetical protein AXW67_36160 [Bradyrhizobium neotropicale]
MKRYNTALLICFLATFLNSIPVKAATNPAEWTLMVFMNGKNNLEPDAIQNFREIASVGSTDKVNVVVEFGRPKTHVTEEAEGWSGVLRFYVKKGQQPVPSAAVMDLRKKPDLSDMGSPAALNDFIDWSVKTYPAKRYMLVVWNHGQGWRFQMARDASLRVTGAARLPASTVQAMSEIASNPSESPQVGGFRAVSFDDDTGRFLYNSDVQKSVAQLATRLNRKLDLIGYDACLMSMIETAYGFRTSANAMVASEELEPGAGWDYAAVMKSITTKPTMTPTELADAVVDAYKARYGNRHLTTLSVVDLTKVANASTSVSDFAKALESALATERSSIKSARLKLQTYGAGDGLRTSIDLPSFLEFYVASTSDERMKTLAKKTLDAVNQTVLTNYASTKSTTATGSKGLAIYFPAERSDFDSDPYKDGYVKTNTDHQVEFVAKERWADFLHSYWQ